MQPDAVVRVMSKGMLAIPHLSAFLGGREVVGPNRRGDAVIGWGYKASGRRARVEAVRDGLPAALLEDGFLRSVGLGKTGAPPVSVVVDDIGMYYVAKTPSRLEAILNDVHLPAGHHTAGADALAIWQSERLSKYNLGKEVAIEGARDKIVLVDQVRGDISIEGAGAGPETFEEMLNIALSQHDARDIVLRVHPDVAAGRARGYLPALARRFGIPFISDDVSPHAIIDEARAIWTVSSGLGFEALLRGVKVITFAAPFYAGWGLTEDRATNAVAREAFARRTRRPTRPNLFAATFLHYARYADPVTKRPLDFAGAVERIVDWRRRDRETAGTVFVCFGVSRWKRTATRQLIGGSQTVLHFRGKATARAARRLSFAPNVRAVIWGMRDRARFAQVVDRHQIPIQRLEDGFLRSVGLGSELLSPGSLVLDGPHLYYDSREPSRLERLLSETEFDEGLKRRAASLIDRIVQGALTKYNLGGVQTDWRSQAAGRPIAVVVEQVPGDASIVLGGGDLQGNLGLLAAVRQAMPAAFVIYKEHPDLVSGNRKGRLPRAHLTAVADAVVSSGDMQSLYGQTDVIHVTSSLAGFEGLLRGIPVTVWGRPFYAGWGLTSDRLTIARRQRRLELSELVAGALILYPLYRDPVTGVPCSVEDFLDALSILRAKHPNPPPAFLLRLWRKLRRLTALNAP